MNSSIYNYLKKRWHEAASHNNQILASYIGPKKHAKILDLGCEAGSLIIGRIKGKIKKPRIWGIDVNKKALSLARKKGIRAIYADINKPLPFKDNYFDIISANQIIEHIVNTDLLLSEIYRVLKPKGYLLLSTENLSSWHNIFALLMGWQAFSQDVCSIKPVGNPLRLIKDPKPEFALHFHIFTLNGLKEVTQLHGFKIQKTFGAGYYPLPSPISEVFSKFDPKHSAFIGIKAIKG